jgi:hypothetical protein
MLLPPPPSPRRCSLPPLLITQFSLPTLFTFAHTAVYNTRVPYARFRPLHPSPRLRRLPRYPRFSALYVSIQKWLFAYITARPPFLSGPLFSPTRVGVLPPRTTFFKNLGGSTSEGGQCSWRFRHSGYTPRVMLFNAGGLPSALGPARVTPGPPILFYTTLIV